MWGGAHTWYLAREGFDTYAFDGSKSAIDNVKHFLDREGLSAKLMVMDGVNLSYEDSYFEAVIDNACIYANLCEDINKMYRECYRVLKPNGLLMTTVFGTKTEGFKTGNELEKNTFTDMTCGRLEGRGKTHFFTKSELEKNCLLQASVQLILMKLCIRIMVFRYNCMLQLVRKNES